MGIKYYRLNTELYEPFWTIDEKVEVYDHIETIVSTLEELVGGTGWLEVTNVEWKSIDNISATGTIDSLPTYIKVDTGGPVYYYYLVDRTNVRAVKNGDVYYDGVYKLDTYMTVYHHKLGKCIDANPNVLANRCFDNRAKTITYGEEYIIDFIQQRYLSNTIPNLNCMMVRNLAYSTTADELWTLNFPDVSVPENVSFGDLSIPFTTLKEANSRGRYEYIVCKPTSIMSSNNSTLRSSNTTQQFIIIPLISGYQEQILHALNDFDITGNHDTILSPFGDNQIGLYECDIPFTMLVGYKESGLYGVTCNCINQPMSSTYDATTLQVPYFKVNNNAPMLFKIVDYTQYTNGMYGKFLNFVNNITEWTPDTEPALWNPTYYKEVYNNGNSNLVSDASRFVFKWSKDSITPVGVQCYLSWSDNLNIAYNYGDLTNTALATLDNTESVDGNLSLSNMYFGSASANYFAQNATTTATNIQVRKSEQTQAWVDASLNTLKDVNNAAKPSSHIIPWRVAADYAQKGVNLALNVAKTMTDTALTQERANNQFRSSINNLASSPSPILSNASTKAVIPNKNGLFANWGIELHPNDKKVIFTDYTHNGYPANEVKQMSDIFNRKFMNILYIDTTYNDEDLRKILWEDEDKYFNTPYWNQMFLAWMNDSHKIYNTWWLINCTDYYSENYISNIENDLPVIPTAKTYIGKYLTSFRTKYPESDILTLLKEDNPDVPDDLWDDIEIVNKTYTNFAIKTKDTSTKYFGTLLVTAIVYNGYINDSGTYHYFKDIDFLCSTSSSWTITCPDGKTYQSSTFDLPIVFNEDNLITTIPLGFLIECSKFNQELTIPSSVKKIYPFFLLNNTSMNSPIHITSTEDTIVYDAFLRGCSNYVSTVEINGDVTNWRKDNNTSFTTSDKTAKCYTTGITISGTARTAIMTKYPNSDSPSYRKLI